jgi:hypothetical protein
MNAGGSAEANYFKKRTQGHTETTIAGDNRRRSKTDQRLRVAVTTPEAGK